MAQVRRGDPEQLPRVVSGRVAQQTTARDTPLIARRVPELLGSPCPVEPAHRRAVPCGKYVRRARLKPFVDEDAAALVELDRCIAQPARVGSHADPDHHAVAFVAPHIGSHRRDVSIRVGFERFDVVLEVNVEDRFARVQPGVVNADLSRAWTPPFSISSPSTPIKRLRAGRRFNCGTC